MAGRTAEPGNVNTQREHRPQRCTPTAHPDLLGRGSHPVDDRNPITWLRGRDREGVELDGA